MTDTDYRAERHRQAYRLRAEVQGDLDRVARLRAVARQGDDIARLRTDLDSPRLRRSRSPRR